MDSQNVKRKRLKKSVRLQIIERIKEFQTKKGLKGKEIAKQMGFTPGNLSQILTGSRDITVDMLIKFKELYGVSTDQILYGIPSNQIGKPKEFIAHIQISNEKEKQMIEETEGQQWTERFVPIPIARGKISGGPPRLVREDPDGVAIIYRDWAHNSEDFTAIWMKGQSMEKTIPDGSLVGIDHSQKDIRELDGKIVAVRKDGEATIKRLRIVSKSMALGIPDNPDHMNEAIVLKGEEINAAIVGKVAWWWGRQT